MEDNGIMTTDENELLTKIGDTFYEITSKFPLVATILQILFFIMLIYRFYQKSEQFSSSFFYILAFYYIVNILYGISENIYNISDNDTILFSIYSGFFAYQKRFYAFCNMILAFNRFTGVFLWKYHRKIWSGRYFKAIFGLTLFYPIIMISYISITVVLTGGAICYIIRFIDCSDADDKIDQYPIWNFEKKIDTIFNVSTAAVAFILGLMTALARKIKGNSWQKKQKYETYLLVETIIASTLLITYEGFKFLSDYIWVTHYDDLFYLKNFKNALIYMSIQIITDFSRKWSF